MFQKYSGAILNEIQTVLRKVNTKEVDDFIDRIISAKKIVTCGAGRMGMMARAFAMRLSHLNMQAFNLGDSNVPRIGKGDLLIVCSGSGETKTIKELAFIAKEHEAQIALLTNRRESSIGKISDAIVTLAASSKVCPHEKPSSIQPMTTLNEQSCLIFLDTLVLLLMNKLKQLPEHLKNRHSILE